MALVSFTPEPLEAQATALRDLAHTAPLVIAGPGASDELCAALGARRLDGDLIEAANTIATNNTD